MKERNRTAGILAAVALLGALWLGIARNAGAPSEAGDPQSAVYAMLEAARAGNVERYLGMFASPALDGLRQTIRESGKAAFSKHLRDTNGSVEGVAVAEPEFEGDTARVRVEYVHRDRNGVQYLYLSKDGRRWRIERADGEEFTQMPIRFGTLVK